jgi:hypothetical protein
MVFLKMIRKEEKDPAFKKFLENGFNYTQMYGLTKIDKEELDKFKKESYTLILLGFVLFFLILMNNVI